MGVRYIAKCSNILSGAVVHQPQGLMKALFSATTFRNMSDKMDCRMIEKKKDKKKCRMPEVIPPEYFKTPDPCKTDEELTAERSLGVYLRCNPPYKPHCMGPCFNEPRIDTKMYRPSKTLDREYKKYWVDCIIEKLPKRPCITVMPKIPRRKPRWNKCGPPPNYKACKTIKPLLCRPLKPGPPTSETRCIKNPLCECPHARKVTRCKVNPKTQCSARRQLTRYPSFSECQSVRLNEAPITECHRKNYSICEAWRVFKRRHS